MRFYIYNKKYTQKTVKKYIQKKSTFTEFLKKLRNIFKKHGILDIKEFLIKHGIFKNGEFLKKVNFFFKKYFFKICTYL